jgi:hypothetical protein
MSSQSRDAGIPLLTEIIEATPVEMESTPAVSQDTAFAEHAIQAEASVEELERRAIASMGSEDWARLERTLRERILRQLLARVDSTLEQRVRDSLADVLQVAVSNLASEIRGGLHESLEDLILRAVSQEVTRLRSTRD